jgi:hypothetical protein
MLALRQPVLPWHLLYRLEVDKKQMVLRGACMGVFNEPNLEMVHISFWVFFLFAITED